MAPQRHKGRPECRSPLPQPWRIRFPATRAMRKNCDRGIQEIHLEKAERINVS